MTHATKYAPRLTAIPAAIAALLLAGCSTGHIGDSWQCPLAEGGLCDSVAAADPAVPDPGAARKTLLTEPLWQQRAGAPGGAVAAPCEVGCDGGFDPFAWLARQIAGDGGGAGPAEAKPPSTEDADPSSVPRREAKAPPLEPPAAALPVEPDPAEENPHAAGLRTGEVVARIWIAPFVDADGVYREASHVRVVLQPAGWRLP